MPSEAHVLSELAFRSKAHWGYSADFMERCREEMTVEAKNLVDPELKFIVAEIGIDVLGYYSLGRIDDEKIELDALFVEPAMIGCGIGKRLLSDAKRMAVRAGANTMIIQGDPHAAGFYLKAGATHIGERPSASIRGRMLPMYEIKLEALS